MEIPCKVSLSAQVLPYHYVTNNEIHVRSEELAVFPYVLMHRGTMFSLEKAFKLGWNHTIQPQLMPTLHMGKFNSTNGSDKLIIQGFLYPNIDSKNNLTQQHYCLYRCHRSLPDQEPLS